MAKQLDYSDILETGDNDIYDIQTHAAGPKGSLPLTPEMLLNRPSGDIFGLSHNTAMGWAPTELRREEFLILSTQGGIRAPDGSPIALGYHTGHWEVGLLMQAVANELKELATIPFAGYCSDPCDGRTQGTVGMMDSLAYRNDAAQIFRRLIRSLPTRKGVVGVATCDKGMPAMMMALASMRELPAVLVPGGVTLPPTTGEDAGKIQTIGARFAHGEISLQDAADMGCRACATPGGGCQFLGTAATSQVIGEALGMSLTHTALSPSGQNIWSDMGLRSARAVVNLAAKGLTMNDIVTPEAIQNAMVVHAAFGGSTNLLLHIPAIAHAAGLPRPTVEDWTEINQRVPRLVDVLPNGPVGHPTIRVFLAGGVPEVMLHLRSLGGILNEEVITATGETLGKNLDWWETSERRQQVRELLEERDNVPADEVILSPDKAKTAGLTSTVTFPRGNLAPEGSVIKSTAIDPNVVDEDGVYRMTGPARVFVREIDAIQTLKGQGDNDLKPGDIIVLCCRGPQGTGMEEVYQLTSALKHLSFGKSIALITDARFSGVSTGACIGHVGPEALADGPIGKVLDGDIIQIEIDTRRLVGSIDLIGDGGEEFGAEAGERVLAARQPRQDLSPDEALPDDTRLWAALQSVGGGTWGGCVYDVDAILDALK